ncbi:MAG: PrgI family protein [Candidatus Falkowbacteria bacterium]
MQTFTVPQFIDVEDKIIGPITTRQFVILLSTGLLVALFYKIFDFSLFVTVTAVAVIVSVTLAFVRINGRPFHFFMLNFIQTFKRPKLRIWLKELSDMRVIEEADVVKAVARVVAGPMVSTSRLDEIALVVDTQGAFRGNDLFQKN